MKEKERPKPQAVKRLEDLAGEVLLNLHLGKLDETLLKEFKGSITRFLAYIMAQERKVE